jgi:hypothetical protein
MTGAFGAVAKLSAIPSSPLSSPTATQVAAVAQLMLEKIPPPELSAGDGVDADHIQLPLVKVPTE